MENIDIFIIIAEDDINGDKVILAMTAMADISNILPRVNIKVIGTRCTMGPDVHLLNLAFLKLNCPYKISVMSTTGKP